MRNRFLIWALAALTLASCADDAATVEKLSVRDHNTLTATIEGADSKTVVETGGNKVLWNAGEEISVFLDGTNHKFTSQNTEVTASAVFSGTQSLSGVNSSNPVWALSPYKSDSEISGEKLTFEIPATQKAVEGSFDPDAHFLAAYSTSTSVNFRNVTGGLRFTLKQSGITGITFKGNDNETLAGKAEVKFVSDIPQVDNVASAVKSITLEAPEGGFKTGVWYYITTIPVQFKKGFTIDFEAGTKSAVFTTDLSVTAGRGVYGSIAEIDRNLEFRDMQRVALEAFYNATGGPQWERSHNWLSDSPLHTWDGISTDEEGFVKGIYMTDNNLSGNLPPEMKYLSRLEELHIVNYTNRPSVGGAIPKEIFQLKKLKRLQFVGCNFTGLIPDPGELTELETFVCQSCKNLAEQPLPASLCNATRLKVVSFYNSNFTGPIPPEWESLTELEQLSLAMVPINTTLPTFFKKMTKLEVLDLVLCGMHGTISSELAENPNWWRLWPQLLLDNNFTKEDLAASHLPGPRNITFTTRNGESLRFEDIYSQNKYTVLFHWSIEFPDSIEYMQKLRRYLAKLPSGSIGIVGSYLSNAGPEKFAQADELVQRYGATWPQIYDDMYSLNRPFGDKEGYAGYPYGSQLEVLVFDSKGELTYASLMDHYPNEWLDMLANEFNVSLDYYESTDFSEDGKVEVLQKASTGNGIDLVLMGDGFSDRLIADGTYRKTLVDMMDGFFSEEPMKSFRHLFNVYGVTAVSKNEEFDEGHTETVFECGFGVGSYCYGNDNKVLSYAQKAGLSDVRMREVLCVVALNKEMVSGTCFMQPPQQAGDYGMGAAVAYFGLGSSEFIGYGTHSVKELILHEAAGHGLAKLGDEYIMTYVEIPDYLKEYIQEREKFGWFKNLSLTGDRQNVKWAHFLNDNRYEAEQLGLYEGGYTVERGIWHPSHDSMMNSSEGMFNAPSREAIYIRMHKLAFGADWTYDYEEFVKYDAINRARFRR